MALDERELVALTFPELKDFIAMAPKPNTRAAISPWNEFASDRQLLEDYRVTAAELSVLRRISFLDRVKSARDFLFILTTIRQSFAGKKENPLRSAEDESTSSEGQIVSKRLA